MRTVLNIINIVFSGVLVVLNSILMAIMIKDLCSKK